MNMSQTGVLIIAHGSSNPKWEKDIEEAVLKVDTELPVVISYLEFSEEKTIEKGIRQLESDGIKTIVSIPLFISSGSTHIDEIKYALGVIAGTPVDTDLHPIEMACDIVWCEPMDDHALVMDLVSERVASLSVNPEKEVLLLVAHGSDESSFHEKWEELLQRMKQALATRFPFKQIVHGTLHPDNLRSTVARLPQETETLVLPLFLCEGYFTNKVIPNRLEGLSYHWEGKTYLPHPLVSSWIENQLEAALANDRQ
jgi:sirohydrochlorin cobaltochelatase